MTAPLPSFRLVFFCFSETEALATLGIGEALAFASSAAPAFVRRNCRTSQCLNDKRSASAGLWTSFDLRCLANLVLLQFDLFLFFDSSNLHLPLHKLPV